MDFFFRLYGCARFWYEWDPFGAFLGFLSVFCGVSLRGEYDPPSPSCGFFGAWMREGVSGFGVDCGGFFGWWRKVLEGFYGRLRRQLAELLVVGSNPPPHAKI